MRTIEESIPQEVRDRLLSIRANGYEAKVGHTKDGKIIKPIPVPKKKAA